MKVGVPKEIAPGERRVALVPETVNRLVRAGIEVLVEAGAGAEALFSDDHYRQAGAQIAPGPRELYGSADVVVKVQRPIVNPALGVHEAELLAEGATLIAFLQPLLYPDLVELLARRRITSFSMDAVPRIARAQAMDALSSQATVAGYKAVLIAADTLPKFFPLMMTAAGTISPAKVLVMGTGVAGLQAIATARRLGAVVTGYDIRPVTKEQVESLGARFVSPQTAAEAAGGYARELTAEEQERERQRVAGIIQDSDVVITTALVPGRRAPVLVTADVVQGMQPGAVIVDVAAEMGGNCELTEPGRTVVKHGVTIHGPLNLPSTMPVHASQMYARNVFNLLALLVADGRLRLDFADQVVRDCCITHQGEVRHEPSRARIAGSRP